MLIERLAPPVSRPRRRQRESNRSYTALFSQLLSAPGQWVAVPLEEIAGRLPANKQVAIHGAAATRNLTVQTTVQEGRIFVRLNSEINAVSDDSTT